MASVVSECVEQVLCVPRSALDAVGAFQGFCPDPQPYLDALLDPGGLSYQPRDTVETDPSFKQLIPYCVFRHEPPDGPAVFWSYRRSKGGEARLDAKRSLGVGGHISSIDGEVGPNAYQVGMQRELDEEVAIDGDHSQRLIGLINDDSNEVGRVHLGFVHLFDLDRPQVLSREASIIDTGFEPLAELRLKSDRFETWSQIVLDHLAGTS